MINPVVRDDAIKVAEVLILLSRQLTEAANSNDMLILRRELSRISEAMQSGGVMLSNGLQSTSFDTTKLRES